VIDSNSAYIAEKLEQEGIRVTRHSCVGDDRRVLVSALCEIAARADMAVATGGLGSTVDDITAAAAAEAAGKTLERHEAAFSSIEAMIQKRGFKMRDCDRNPAMLPKGARFIENKRGLAPGFSLKINQCLFFFLPGVPFEMRGMLSDGVLPRAAEEFGTRRSFFKNKTLSTFGLTESTVNEGISGFANVFPDIKPGLRARFPEIQVKLYARGDSADALDSRVKEAVKWVRERLGDAVFSTDGKSLPETAGQALLERNATLSIAESCTGGLISSMITDVAGSSDYFLFSGVTYSNQAKINALNVRASTIETHGAVHEATALEMAVRTREIGRSTYGLATSGVAGPGGGTPDRPVGTVCVGMAGPDFSQARTFHFPFQNRLWNKKIFAFTALDMLRKKIRRSLKT
jgi:nicotinamide-nucleotide amidase